MLGQSSFHMQYMVLNNRAPLAAQLFSILQEYNRYWPQVTIAGNGFGFRHRSYDGLLPRLWYYTFINADINKTR